MDLVSNQLIMTAAPGVCSCSKSTAGHRHTCAVFKRYQPHFSAVHGQSGMWAVL